ncbi:TraX family protein [Stenotrophomonas sp. JC08]|uniref:TraX family protein n=1 Tax=Stenotrophomonas sp. JC08 TaxID=3445779 RepID=UPI003FA33E7C
MTSSGRELLKWIALVLMTGDHVAKVIYGGYVPVVSELGRVAFPVFALVMAYNLAQPKADAAKSLRRLLLWGVIAQPVHAWAFGAALPLNVLLSFALAAACVVCIQRRSWLLLVLLAGPAPLLVDYQWAGTSLLLAGWLFFQRPGIVRLPLLVLAFAGLCLFNGNTWALLALPVLILGGVPLYVPRTRWAFYGYYVGHLALLAGFLYLNPSVVYAPESLPTNATFTGP